MTHAGPSIILLAAICLVACSSEPVMLPAIQPPVVGADFYDSPPTRTINTTIADDCPPIDDLYHFFPKNFFTLDASMEVPVMRTMNGAFIAMREPSFSCGSAPDEGYRLMGGGAFGFKPWSIRVFRQGPRYRLVAVKFGYEYQPAERFWEIERVDRDLSHSDWEAITDQIYRDRYWFLASVVAQPVMDGAGWLFEGRHGIRYHPVRRVALRNEPLARTAILLRKLSGLTLESERFGLGDAELPR